MLSRTQSRSIRQIGSYLTAFWLLLLGIPLTILITQGIERNRVGWTNLILCGSITILFLVRFAIGNTKYLAETYTSSAPWVERILKGHGKLSGRHLAVRMLCDSTLLIVMGAAFTGMARYAGDLTHFVSAFEVLLFSDMLWVFYEPKVWPKLACIFADAVRWRLVRKPDPRKSYYVRLNWDADYAPRTWTWNNALLGVLLWVSCSVTHRFGGEYACLLTVGLMTAIASVNGYIDLRKTHFGAAGMRC